MNLFSRVGKAYRRSCLQLYGKVEIVKAHQNDHLIYESLDLQQHLNYYCDTEAKLTIQEQTTILPDDVVED